MLFDTVLCQPSDCSSFHVALVTAAPERKAGEIETAQQWGGTPRQELRGVEVEGFIPDGTRSAPHPW